MTTEDIKDPAVAKLAEEQSPAHEPAGVPVPTKKQHPQKVENPKSEQCTGRCTVDEKARILAACEAQKVEGETMDVVRLCLKMLDYIEKDFLQTFKTK